ncbi:MULTISPECIES: thioredoxin family protein [unclassified Myroides]|uniref:thioredoxin family protein n=1 Tax=unclassified Myroides TaxID=2642485 RepID=UPI0015FB3164|nr:MULTISPECIES: thioredoxin family protein [unclassified Myroides]MBB1149335.1 thioredoxin family protein [Myroides sp. NP-2]MDM1406760.1 thioredoxin family protein [Myroides sp. DF42-4-2]
MKRKIFFVVTLLSTLAFMSCKKEGSTIPQPTQEATETTPTTEVDTVALKKQIEQEKETLSKPYNEEEDAQAKLDALIAQANKEGKFVFVQAGGNWCIWCLRFNDFVQQTPELKQVVDQNYLYYHLNYSKNNKNKAVFDKYTPNSKGLGYPFFFVIDGTGKVTNIISSEALEEGKGYSTAKVKEMFIANAPKK